MTRPRHTERAEPIHPLSRSRRALGGGLLSTVIFLPVFAASFTPPAGSPPWPDLVHPLLRHIALAAAGWAAALMVGLPLGIARAHPVRFSATIVRIFSFIAIIPPIALLAFLVIIPKFHQWAAWLGVFLCSLAPFAYATESAMRAIPSSLCDSAVVLGLGPVTQLQLFLTLSGRVLLQGARRSALASIATATLAGFIGAGGFGELVASGLINHNVRSIIAGATATVVLAALVQWAFTRADRRLDARRFPEIRGDPDCIPPRRP